MKKWISVLLILLLFVTMLPACGCAEDAADETKTLVVSSGEFTSVFSPFFSTSVSDTNIAELVCIQLMYCDRNESLISKGSQGVKKKYNGKKYTYYTPADCVFSEGEDGTYYYDFTLRDDLKCSDGIPLTVDDVIFSMYVYSDPDYFGRDPMNTEPILGMENYQSGKADYIEGIRKIDDTHLRIVTTRNSLRRSFMIAPLHYYGDPAQYDYDTHRFGFPKGDLSIVREKSAQPLGAGPYRFVSFKDGKVTLEANPYYYKGEPKIKTVILDSTPDAGGIDALLEGRVDITDGMTKKTAETIKTANGNKKLDGKVIAARTYDDLGYYFFGINANLVNVGGDPGSEESKALRKAFATLFCAYREATIDEYYGDTAYVINYPITSFVWAAPQPKDKDYRVAFSVDVNGEPIYTKKMKKPEQKYEAALQAALGFFEKAGYTVEDGKLTAAPEGAALEYSYMYYGNGTDEDLDTLFIKNVSPALESIGMKLNTDIVLSYAEKSEKLDNGQAQMWIAGWGGGSASGLSGTYFSDAANGPTSEKGKNPAGGPNQGIYNVYFGVADPELDQMLLDADAASMKEGVALYKEVMERALDWAVEIPFCGLKTGTFFSAERINVKTIPDAITCYYDWMREIENLEMK